MVALSLPDYMQQNPRTSRPGHLRSFCRLHTAKDYLHTAKDYYIEVLPFPLAIVLWNALSEEVVSSPSLDIFKAAVLVSCSTQSSQV